MVQFKYPGVSGFTFFKKKYIVFYTNRVDPDEMQHHVAFHLSIHCLQKYSFRGFVNTKGSCFSRRIVNGYSVDIF